MQLAQEHTFPLVDIDGTVSRASHARTSNECLCSLFEAVMKEVRQHDLAHLAVAHLLPSPTIHLSISESPLVLAVIRNLQPKMNLFLTYSRGDIYHRLKTKQFSYSKQQHSACHSCEPQPISCSTQ